MIRELCDHVHKRPDHLDGGSQPSPAAEEAQLPDVAVAVGEATLGLLLQLCPAHASHHATGARLKGCQQVHDGAALLVRPAKDVNDALVLGPANRAVVAGHGVTIQLALDADVAADLEPGLLHRAVELEAVHGRVVAVLLVSVPNLAELDREPGTRGQGAILLLLDGRRLLASNAPEDDALEEAVASQAVAAVNAAGALARRKEAVDLRPLSHGPIGPRQHLSAGGDFEASHAVVDAWSDPGDDEVLVRLGYPGWEDSLPRLAADLLVCRCRVLPQGVDDGLLLAADQIGQALGAFGRLEEPHLILVELQHRLAKLLLCLLVQHTPGPWSALSAIRHLIGIAVLQDLV
mmetsp:Transcript_4925/g.11378  ORF Transcript_4925/g.11378 Transcript_4925/m.11378 type:complete len:348 (+) Transcript_4925:444-1487(+)